jgi:UDP-N-acetylglucosamine diphosphorylase / glucose-1-phosphate thymidylyltransferase / UDP-N-acetylgalactosamine diphosphorylase / glucosamine-1-phosphate N-acetyltransferase / galactosamine-1-phosphate N-acetyltransferase
MNICIFEDFFIHNLTPVNYLRHTSELICGALTLQEKILSSLPNKTKLTLHSRRHIAGNCGEKFPKTEVNNLPEGEYVFLNSRVLFDEKNIKQILKHFKKEKNSALTQDKTVIAFTTSEEKTKQLREVINTDESDSKDDNLISLGDIEWLNLTKSETNDYKLINYASDLVLYNEEELRKDLKQLIKGKKKLHISSKNKSAKNIVFDTSHGSIYIGKNTVIEPFSYIQGPVYIGDNCTVRAGSLLYGPVSIGDWSKVSGEITHSVLHSYVNKQHLGFLGHSYLCEWINLGAGTTTSNLKNNYSKISININGQNVNTGSIFLGSIIGDHTKTGIQSMMNTGTLVGISSNLYGAGYHNKLIKSFSWNDASSGGQTSYDLAKAIQTAKVSMSRRKVEMSKAYEDMLIYLYENKDEIPL